MRELHLWRRRTRATRPPRELRHPSGPPACCGRRRVPQRGDPTGLRPLAPQPAAWPASPAEDTPASASRGGTWQEAAHTQADEREGQGREMDRERKNEKRKRQAKGEGQACVIVREEGMACMQAHTISIIKSDHFRHSNHYDPETAAPK